MSARTTALALVSALVAAIVLGGCSASGAAAMACLSRPDIMTLTGEQPRFVPDATVTIADGTTIDATAATWDNTTASNYPVFIQRFPGEPRNDLCFLGGGIASPYGPSTPWTTWHGVTGLVAETPSFEAIGVSIWNEGDGLDFDGTHATDWTVRAAHLATMHDDCLEDDEMNSGLIDDSLFDGCYSGISARGWPGHTFDGSANTITITNSLIRLEPMPTVFKGPAPGTADFFKFADDQPDEGISPRLVVRNTIFRADQAPGFGDLGTPHYTDPTTGESVPYPIDCSDDTMVWLGSGPFPGHLPSCFTITTDPSVWDDAVTEWTNSHQP